MPDWQLYWPYSLDFAPADDQSFFFLNCDDFLIRRRFYFNVILKLLLRLHELSYSEPSELQNK